MPSISEALNSGKPPLGAALADGVRTLSADQTLNFSLYKRYVFPLDGMNYWIRIPSSANNVRLREFSSILAWHPKLPTVEQLFKFLPVVLGLLLLLVGLSLILLVLQIRV